MRHVCIQQEGKVSQICGILTDYRGWYFTHYDMRVELINARMSAEGKESYLYPF